MAISSEYVVRVLSDRAINQIMTAVKKSTLAAQRAIGDSFAEELGPQVRADVNARAVEAGRLATLETYDETVTDNGHIPYTRRTRFGGGALRRALESDQFATSDSEGIQFGNVSLLNQKAKQWGRLNFGAGAAGSGSALLNEPARPAFLMPEGIFRAGKRGPRVGFNLDRQGQDVFFPRSSRATRGGGRIVDVFGTPLRMFPTRGIEARHFLDAGVEALSSELHHGYLERLKRFDRQVQDRMRRAARSAEQ